MSQETLNPKLLRFSRLSAVVGVLALAVSLFLAFLGAESFFQSYLYAYLFWFGLSLGCFAMLMAQHLAGGSWGAMIRRPLEAGVALLPLMALLFLPVLLGLGFLYEWTDLDFMTHNEILEAKLPWLNRPFFIIRTFIYFAIWLVGAWMYLRWSRQQDQNADPDLQRRMARYSAPWLIIYVLTMTLAAYDWGMSLEPEWFSGIYGGIFMVGQVISAVALMVLVMVALYAVKPVNELLTEKRLQDLGNFLLGFSMVWAYFNASQLIIIWSGNLPETNMFYVLRFDQDWVWVATFLFLFHFFVPFFILFSRWVKRKRRALMWVAIWLLFMRLVDIFWIIVPAFHRDGFPIRLTDPLLLIGFGGVWLAAFAWTLSRQAIVPPNDQRLTGVLEHA